jgi:hypothetical protein
VIPVAAKREEDDTLCSSVDELATHRRADAGQMVWAKHVLGPLDDQGELALEHQVDLLLSLVSVNAQPLAWLQHDEVHAKRLHPERATQRLQAIATAAIEHGE